jgi:hypothetical protein
MCLILGFAIPHLLHAPVVSRALLAPSESYTRAGPRAGVSARDPDPDLSAVPQTDPRAPVDHAPIDVHVAPRRAFAAAIG